MHNYYFRLLLATDIQLFLIGRGNCTPIQLHLNRLKQKYYETRLCRFERLVLSSTDYEIETNFFLADYSVATISRIQFALDDVLQSKMNNIMRKMIE